MKRLNWIDELSKTIDAHRALPFRWGGRDDSHDCCTFAAACIDAMTDRRCVDELLKHYSDESSAADYIRTGGGLVALISQFLGAPKRVRLMQLGDVVLGKKDGTHFVGVCFGDVIYSAGPEGVVQNDRRCATVAWSI